MLKNIAKLEVIIEGKTYQFLCDQDSSLMHIKEALFQFQKYVGQIEDTIREAQEKSAREKSEDEKQEESNQENKVA